MGGKKLITICQFGGLFETQKDGTLAYNGGEAHAIDIDNETRFQDFKSEIAEIIKCNSELVSVKYFLLGNKKTLITISSDKEFKRMISFNGDSVMVDVYVSAGETVGHDHSNMPCSRSSRTTLSEAFVPVDIARLDYHNDDAVHTQNDIVVDLPVDLPPVDSISPPPSSPLVSSFAKPLDDPSTWGNAITGVRQRFSDVHEFREALRRYAVANKFMYKLTKNDSRRVTVKCKAEDIEKGLRESIAEIFENAYHGYCLHYLTNKFRKDLPSHFSNEVKQLLVEDLYAAASSLKVEDFQRSIESIKGISPEAFNWLMSTKPEHWANALFGGARYDHMTSKFGKVFYSWVSEAYELPITQMVHMIREKMMEMINTRSMDSNQWLTRLTPLMEEKLQKETLEADSLGLEVSFLPDTDSIFDVRDRCVEKVDIDQWICSCKRWQITEIGYMRIEARKRGTKHCVLLLRFDDVGQGLSSNWIYENCEQGRGRNLVNQGGFKVSERCVDWG
ncbi:Far1-related sequence like [Thalictrum thalictroides]|uniref:Far1-related sequence like n=1 Tax=Thalictrum thalictroides TaxID=46969 RepID=A0A7J6VZB9_THATH|nr:Far1-related sequence like [Thalictrum thalictroides]